MTGDLIGNKERKLLDTKYKIQHVTRSNKLQKLHLTLMRAYRRVLTM